MALMMILGSRAQKSEILYVAYNMFVKKINQENI